ncbi:MAG: MlaD family protein [candidate division Zixibacteria bacterium]
MNRSSSIKWGSLKVGALLMIVTVILFWASFTGGGTSIFESKGKFVCYFPNVSGLVNGSPVWMAGVEVGNVKKVRFVSLDELRQVEVVCRVKKSVWHMLTPDANVTLGTIGFLGDKYIEIVPGMDGGVPIAEWDTVSTLMQPDASALFSSGQAAFDNVGSLVHSLDTFLTGMNQGEGTLGKLATDSMLYANMTILLANLSELTAGLQKNQERLVTSMEETSNAISKLSGEVTNNSGTLSRMLNDPALYDNLTATSARLDTVMSQIQAADGSLGLMVSDTAMYVEMVNLMQRISNLVTDIKANPRRYFKFSVF